MYRKCESDVAFQEDLHEAQSEVTYLNAFKSGYDDLHQGEISHSTQGGAAGIFFRGHDFSSFFLTAPIKGTCPFCPNLVALLIVSGNSYNVIVTPPT